MHDIKNILNLPTRLPTYINRALVNLNIFNNTIYGKRYKVYLQNRLLNNYQKFDNSIELINIVNTAIKKVPYYNKKYKQISSVDEFINNIGFIDRNIVMQNHSDFIANNINRTDFIEGTTGGTSGIPLKLIIPKSRHVFELATMHTMWNITGWSNNKIAVIRNHKLSDNKNFVINPITKEYIFDNFRLNDEYMHIIYQTIKKYNIQYVHAYPSAAYQFSVFIKQNKLDPTIIKAFLSGSENVFNYQIDLIQNQVGIRFYTWYGHSEKLILGGYCKFTNYYHFEPTYGYAELIDENGKSINTPGQVGEIVGTTLHNNGMPLIRYKTGDYAEYVGDKCKHCKRELLILKNIVGRWSGERVYNKDGSFVTTTALNLHDDLYSVINGIQYIQDKKGELEVLIIKSNIYTENHRKRLFEHFNSKLKKDTHIKIRNVEKLIIQPNGKFLHLISNVDK